MDMSPERIDPVSGNEIPLGATAENVRDDIPAQLSEGEYVVPADVVNYYGVKFFEDLRSDAKEGYQEMAATGRIGGEPIDDQDSFPFSLEELAVEGESEYNTGGVVQANEGIYARRSGISLPSRASVAPAAPVAPAPVTTSIEAAAEERAGTAGRRLRPNMYGGHSVTARRFINPRTGQVVTMKGVNIPGSLRFGDMQRDPETGKLTGQSSGPTFQPIDRTGQPYQIPSDFIPLQDLPEDSPFYESSGAEGYTPYGFRSGFAGLGEYAQRRKFDPFMSRDAEGELQGSASVFRNDYAGRPDMQLDLFDRRKGYRDMNLTGLVDSFDERMATGKYEGQAEGRIGAFQGNFGSLETNKILRAAEEDILNIDRQLLEPGITPEKEQELRASRAQYAAELTRMQNILYDKGLDRDADGLEDSFVEKFSANTAMPDNENLGLLRAGAQLVTGFGADDTAGDRVSLAEQGRAARQKAAEAASRLQGYMSATPTYAGLHPTSATPATGVNTTYLPGEAFLARQAADRQLRDFNTYQTQMRDAEAAARQLRDFNTYQTQMGAATAQPSTPVEPYFANTERSFPQPDRAPGYTPGAIATSPTPVAPAQPVAPASSGLTFNPLDAIVPRVQAKPATSPAPDYSGIIAPNRPDPSGFSVASSSDIDRYQRMANARARAPQAANYQRALEQGTPSSLDILASARRQERSAADQANIARNLSDIQRRLESNARGGSMGFNEGGQVRGYQYGGMPQLVPLEEEIDVSNLPNIDRPTVVSDGSSVAEAAERRANLGDFFRNLPGNVASAASSAASSVSNAAAYAADPSNYIPSAEERAAVIAANQAAADERRAVNQKLYDGVGEITSNVADLASNAASFTGARLSGLAQVPGTMASNAATMYHRMEGGAERDAYDAGYQAGYKAGLNASGKMSSQPGGRGAAPVESGTYGRGTVAGPTAEQIQYSPLSSYTLRSANAARLSDTSANLTGAAATRGAAPVATGTYGRGTVAGPTAAQLRSTRDPMPSQPASPVNNDPIPSQPGVAPFMDPIPSQPGVAPKRYADPIPGAPDLVPTPQSYLSGLSAPLEDFPMETFSMKRPSPADAPMTQTQQERQSVQDRIAELRAQLGQTDTNTEAAVPNTATSVPNALERANMRLDLLLGGN